VGNVHEWNANNVMDPADSLDQNPAPCALDTGNQARLDTTELIFKGKDMRFSILKGPGAEGEDS
jgi:hypothetical protein